MRVLVCGYGTGSRSGDQARQYKTLRIDAGDASKGTKIAKHGVRVKTRHSTSLNIAGRTRKVGDSLDNDVEILLYDLSRAEIAALIGRLLEMAKELSAERHGTDHVRRGRDRVKLTRAVMKSLAVKLEQDNHIEILDRLIASFENTQEGWETFRKLGEITKDQRDPGEDSSGELLARMISVYSRALSHLRAARRISGAWWSKEVADKAVELVPVPGDAVTQ